MSEMEEKLEAILNNPQMMQQIMALAQSMGSNTPNTHPKTVSEPSTPPSTSAAPEADLKMLQNLSGFLKQGGVDQNQTALLSALSPYLSRDRLSRLERAMQAARMAGMASSFLGAGGLQMLNGR